MKRYPPSAFLLAAQLLMLILLAAFEGTRSQQALISALGTVVLILVVWVVIHSPAASWVAWVLAVPALLLTLLSIVDDSPDLPAWSSLLEGVLYLYAAGSLIAYMMSDDEVTVDELFAAGSTFTLLAWGFAYIYLVIQAWAPGSFVSSVITGRALSFVEMLSLSFTNLTATGLSDILPGTTPARAVIMLEQFAGVGYVAMVVSRLVGLAMQRQKQKTKQG